MGFNCVEIMVGDIRTSVGGGLGHPQRAVQQPPKGHGQARGCNGVGHRQRAPSRGSTHSYVASTISENLGIFVDSTSAEVTILSPLGQSAWVCKLYRDVPLVVQGAVFLANLMELPFGEFDLILGMDWLVKHQISLDCTTKRIVLRTKDDVEVVMIGEHRDYLSNVISALVADK
ncbi:uncharacterized protein [Gossypium hirsutum]|uniref:Uncharacterized protein n=1 Tax=Gossypium hirsutum TaxID=3635 RepID=A0ABM2ZBY9_GOSHI|nr:uncharacterized protein LOC121211240 [Gossypium hirsutum]